jgi:hypothetical protein
MRQSHGTAEDVTRITFNVETLVSYEGRTMDALIPDEEGYYCNYPVAVLGAVSRNNTYYTVDAFHRQIADKGSHFNMVLEQGNLEGELGHPSTEGLTKTELLNRLCEVRSTNVSHHIRRVATGSVLETGRLVIADIAPSGPHAEVLRRSFDSPRINTAFSLRSLARERILSSGVREREMLKLVTFDAVSAGGYYEASKRFVQGSTESLLDVTALNDNDLMFDAVAIESFSDTEIAEIFGTDKVGKITRQTTIVQNARTLADIRDRDSAKQWYHKLIRAE